MVCFLSSFEYILSETCFGLLYCVESLWQEINEKIFFLGGTLSLITN